MNCEKYHKDISRFVDGHLPPESSAALMRHLETCPECRTMSEAMAALNSQLKVAAPQVDSALAVRVKAIISRQDSETLGKRILPLWSRASLLAAIVLLALGLGNLAGRSISEIIIGDHRDSVLEMLSGDSARSLADVVMDLGPEEQ